MQDFAMPQSLELESSRRNALPALRREVIHNTTTQNEYRPQELCYIPLDTGAAGAFMDVGCTRLELTVVVQNKNYFIDFINLPRCGWHSLIQEFGIEINNGIHELNRHYAECVELEMIKMGQNKVPFLYTAPNPWKPADGTAGKFHINFIKPSMVTAQGLPHNVQYPSLSTLTSATTPDTITQSMLLYSNPFLSESVGTVSSLPAEISGSSISLNDAGWFVSSSFDLAQAYYDDRIIGYQTSTVKSTFASAESDVTQSTTAYYPGTGEGQTPNVNYIADSNGYVNNNTKLSNRLRGMPHGGALLSRYSKVNPALQSTISIYNVSPGQATIHYPPSQWPAKQPCPFDELQCFFHEQYNHVNSDAILNYYANCKNIPVGIPLSLTGASSGSDQIWGNKLHTAPTTDNFAAVGAQTEFQLSLKIYSSLIGELAKKWFPELVVPQGRMRVRIRWQEPQIVFQTLMDPCRRVPGTSRDWYPNLGVVSTEGQYVASIALCPVSCITSGIHPIMVSNYQAGDVYIDSIALGKYPIPMMRMKMVHDLFTAFDIQNLEGLSASENSTYLAGGGSTQNYRFGTTLYGTTMESSTSIIGGSLANFVKNQSSITGFNALNALNQYHSELRCNGEFGYPIYVTPNPGNYPPTSTITQYDAYQFPGMIAEYWNYTHPEDWHSRYRNQVIANPTETMSTAQGRTKDIIWYTEQDTGAPAQNPKFKTDPTYDWDTKALNWNPFCFPTPQYLPMSSASDKRTSRILDKNQFVNENETAFGTYREHSVAQVRRTHTSLYPLQIPDSVTARIDERLTYMIKNVQIVTQQIVLPRTAALSIIENALNGGISMETHAWKEMESMLPRQETQKALINMAAAFCTDISFVFRPINTYQGDVAFGYNSFSFYNPFTSFRFEFDSSLTPNSSSERDYNYLGGRPIYYNECIIQQRVGFDIQLQLSSELLPRQPIDSIRRLIQHVRWGDQVFSDRDYMQLDPHIHPSYGTQKGMVINTLQDGFWACYVPISALDDQTITCNPFFAPTEISLRKMLRGKRAPINALPFYKPFDGTFHLSFNLETFMGQNEKIRTGVPIVNNNMFLKMDKCHLLRDYDTQLLTIAQCDARVVFERGGTMQFFT